jgi:uncharacterized membrane-anchored protein
MSILKLVGSIVHQSIGLLKIISIQVVSTVKLEIFNIVEF